MKCPQCGAENPPEDEPVDMKVTTRRIKPTITGLLLEWRRRADEQAGG